MTIDKRDIDEIRDSLPTSGITPNAAILTLPTEDAPVEREFTVQSRSQWRTITRRFLRHRLALASLVVFLIVVVGSLIGEHAWTYGYKSITNDINQAPSTTHPFGTDANGDDLLAQVFRGVQTSAEVGFIVAILSTAFGTVYGAVAGYYSGKVDTALMRVVDLVLTLPQLAILLLLSVKYAGGGSALPIALVLAALLWASISRVIRGLVLSLREKEYVEAARAIGASDRRIVFRHLLPNTLGAIIVNATIVVSVAIVVEAGLSFLGFGIKAPNVSLGLLISQGIGAADTRPWLFYFPGAVLVIIALTVNFIGDGLRDALDPQQTRVRA